MTDKVLTGRLENWFVLCVGDLYTPPECQSIILCGEIYEHKGRWKDKDGYKIQTSYIKDVEGCIVLTSSGSRYLLGKPSSDYINWCKINGIELPTAEEPIRIKPCGYSTSS